MKKMSLFLFVLVGASTVNMQANSGPKLRSMVHQMGTALTVKNIRLLLESTRNATQTNLGKLNQRWEKTALCKYIKDGALEQVLNERKNINDNKYF